MDQLSGLERMRAILESQMDKGDEKQRFITLGEGESRHVVPVGADGKLHGNPPPHIAQKIHDGTKDPEKKAAWAGKLGHDAPKQREKWELNREEFEKAHPDESYDKEINRAALLGHIPYEHADKHSRLDSTGNKHFWAKTRAEVEQDGKDAVRRAKGERTDINKLNPSREFSPQRQRNMSAVAKRDIEHTEQHHRGLLDVHRDRVAEALESGKSVPDDVLKDYPELQRDASPKAGARHDSADMSDDDLPAALDSHVSDLRKKHETEADDRTPQAKVLDMRRRFNTPLDSSAPLAIYNGKAVDMGYIADPKKQFNMAAMRIQDNGAEGHVVTAKGEVYKIGRSTRTAKRLTGEEADTVLDSASTTVPKGEEKQHVVPFGSDGKLYGDPPPPAQREAARQGAGAGAASPDPQGDRHAMLRAHLAARRSNGEQKADEAAVVNGPHKLESGALYQLSNFTSGRLESSPAKGWELKDEMSGKTLISAHSGWEMAHAMHERGARKVANPPDDSKDYLLRVEHAKAREAEAQGAPDHPKLSRIASMNGIPLHDVREEYRHAIREHGKEQANAMVDSTHRTSVKMRLLNDEHVHAEDLAGYPDLAEKHGKPS